MNTFAPDPDMSHDVLDANVVVLNNFFGPHHWKQWQHCSKRVKKLSILLSTEMEPNRQWTADWGDLDIHVQKNWMLTRKWKHKSGFEEDNYIHIPYDTKARLQQLNPDVILSYEMGMRTLFCTRYVAKNPNCKLVMVGNMSEQTESNRGRIRPVLRKYLRKRVDLATYNGPSCRRYMLKQGFDEARLMHFHYVHDAAKVWRHEKSFNDQVTRLFCCGALSERKGVKQLGRALVSWCEKNPDRKIELVMAGDGPLNLVLQTMSRPSNLQIEMLGNIGSDELASQYGQADVMVFPTLADEWGLVVNESLESGLPVLSSCLAQSTELLVQDGVNGWVFDPTDNDSFNNAVARALATSHEKLHQMSRVAANSVQSLTLDSSADCFHAIVKKALSLK